MVDGKMGAFPYFCVKEGEMSIYDTSSSLGTFAYGAQQQYGSNRSSTSASSSSISYYQPSLPSSTTPSQPITTVTAQTPRRQAQVMKPLMIYDNMYISFLMYQMLILLFPPLVEKVLMDFTARETYEMSLRRGSLIEVVHTPTG